VLVADLLRAIERLAPAYLAQPWDNCGLLVGDESAPVQRVLATLELTETVLDEAVTGGSDTVLTHHPLLFTPLRTVVESHPKERLVRELVAHSINLIACHTNLDAAPGGIADIVAEALELQDVTPLEPASAGWAKFVGFVPKEALDRVAASVFTAGAGGIGNYSECGFACEGVGWFTPGAGSRPAVGEVSNPERTAEVRWETVAPRERVAAVVRAFVAAHPYEEPAFDIYPVEDVLPLVGLGRVGTLPAVTTVAALAQKVAELFELPSVSWCGDGNSAVRRVGLWPGSGRGSLEKALGRCDVLVTGDLGYHDGELPTQRGLALVDAPHGELEWWAFKRWCEVFGGTLAAEEVSVTVSQRWRSNWNQVGDWDSTRRRLGE
jgi:dinuclear metal center YbgI/SA1388 family protein